MEYRPLCKKCDKVSVVGMGTYYDPLWIVLSRFNVFRGAEEKVKAIKAGIEHGINFIDTAELYGSEHLVREAIKEYKRDQLFIATKVWRSHLKREQVLKAIDGSLRRLGLTYVDLYQIHFPSYTVPIEETIHAMEDLVDKGKVRYIGISNFSLEKMKKAVESFRKYELASTQMNYSLANREIERDIIPFCRENGIGVIAYYPLGHGKLIRNREVNDVAKRLGKTPAQVVLNWVINKGAFPIPRASRESHVIDNVLSAGWELSPEDIRQLES
ncbi:aldo/keto reductase [Sulfolobales archaeon HS-7]|nr:aldo/keto reductase [Sulfolobales archaeon HS-7]